MSTRMTLKSRFGTKSIFGNSVELGVGVVILA